MNNSRKILRMILLITLNNVCFLKWATMIHNRNNQKGVELGTGTLEEKMNLVIHTQ